MKRIQLPQKYRDLSLRESLDFHVHYKRPIGWEEGYILPWATNGPVFGSLPEEQVWMLVPVDPKADQLYQIDYYESDSELQWDEQLPFDFTNELVERKIVKNKGWDGDLDANRNLESRAINDIAAIFVRPAYVTNIIQYGLPHSNHSPRSDQDLDRRQWLTKHGLERTWLPIMTTLPSLGYQYEINMLAEYEEDDTIQWVIVSIDPAQWKVGGAWNVGLPIPHSQDLKKLLSDYDTAGTIPGSTGNSWIWNPDPDNPLRWPMIHVEGVDHTIFLDKQAQNLMISNFSIGFHAAINKTTL